MKKRIVQGAVVLILAPIMVYLGLVLHNNLGAAKVRHEAVSQSLEASIRWLQVNEQKVLKEGNPMLWWMVKRSFDITSDYRLGQLYKRYKARYIDRRYHNYWRVLFDRQYVPILSTDQIAQLPDYNQYFLYGLTCSDKLAASPVIKRQLSTDFCAEHHPISPACVTHQMMGVYFRQQRDCGDKEALADQMRTLQDTVVQQLIWDPRAVDVYIQRILMLLDTGAGEQIKPRWLQRLVRAQLPSGAWSGFRPLLPMGSDKYLGFYSKGVTIGQPDDSFHATAQGLLVMALLSRGEFPTLLTQ